MYAQTVPSKTTPPKARRVLIAEDNADLRDILTQLFLMYDFEVITAQDGQEALENLDASLPDILLLDINMPRVSGLEVLSYVREHKTIHKLKVIIMTGNTLISQNELAQQADLILIKPLNIEELIIFVARLVR